MNPLLVFWIFLKLGLTSFGGPIAHIGFLHDEFVNRRQWLSEKAYTELVSLCHFLPGPASSQIVMALGFSKASYLGALLAILGFALPSILFLLVLALGLTQGVFQLPSALVHGLKIAAVAIVAQAVLSMYKKNCRDHFHKGLMTLSLILSLLYSSTVTQLLIIFTAGVLGYLAVKNSSVSSELFLEKQSSKRASIILLASFLSLLLILPLAVSFTGNQVLLQFDSYYRAGSLVFGGGHVVLPLLKNAVVNPGWVSASDFMTGYGLAQAVPGPLFTFAAYLGASSLNFPTGWLGGTLAVVAIFLPSYLLIIGALPLWEQLRKRSKFLGVIAGINAAVVGILMAALYNPVWTTSILNRTDFTIAAISFSLLTVANIPSWLIVLGCGLLNWLVHFI